MKLTKSVIIHTSRHCFEVADRTDEVKTLFKVVDGTDEVSSKHCFEVVDVTYTGQGDVDVV
ncbi:N-ethylammeline chlorohydrolase [Streptococcus pneumoniae]|nr:N-ethylammeline chlorohydrolase [Streptococcus pneumoniae]